MQSLHGFLTSNTMVFYHFLTTLTLLALVAWLVLGSSRRNRFFVRQYEQLDRDIYDIRNQITRLSCRSGTMQDPHYRDSDKPQHSAQLLVEPLFDVDAIELSYDDVQIDAEVADTDHHNDSIEPEIVLHMNAALSNVSENNHGFRAIGNSTNDEADLLTRALKISKRH